MTNKLIFHPFSIACTILATIMTVGISGYIAAFIAKEAFVWNSLAIGVISLLWCLLGIEVVIQFPVSFILLALLTLGVAYLAGLLRLRQVKKNVV